MTVTASDLAADGPARKMRDTTINYGPANPQPRASNDWYCEPTSAVEALLAAERFSGRSWDPACGRGTIPKAMFEAGLDCCGSDIVDRGYECSVLHDFIKDDPARYYDGVDNIISNPPFNLARPFIDKALTIASHKVAMLLPLTFLEGQARARWLATTPLARVHVFSWRISMPPGELFVAGKIKAEGGKKCFAWFCWEHGWQGPPQINLLIKPAVTAATTSGCKNG
jgi:hypothetical protein